MLAGRVIFLQTEEHLFLVTVRISSDSVDLCDVQMNPEHYTFLVYVVEVNTKIILFSTCCNSSW